MGKGKAELSPVSINQYHSNNEKTKIEIEQARERIKNGEYFTYIDAKEPDTDPLTEEEKEQIKD